MGLGKRPAAFLDLHRDAAHDALSENEACESAATLSAMIKRRWRGGCQIGDSRHLDGPPDIPRRARDAHSSLSRTDSGRGRGGGLGGGGAEPGAWGPGVYFV